MSNIIDMTGHERAADELQHLSVSRVSSYGSGGGSDMLEQRVARLEADMGEVKADLKGLRNDVAGLRSDLAELKGKVSMLPGYPGIAVIMAIVSGAFLLAQRVLESGAAP